ncbi:hypothetical protein [Streptacidiphilus rugosus]|uniref:hypothetical protein n=1 Tax=Streptacidiphilus rugosus TaxID=405783 RepID=UPI000568523E|nr:hypothetical protein [Streptacidiphilus rugosus]
MALASLVVTAAISGVTPLAAHAAGPTGTPSEVATIPAPTLAPRADSVYVAGATGFLHQEQGRPGYTWTDYAGGTDTPVPQLTGKTFPVRSPYYQLNSAGGDKVAYWTPNATGPASLTVGDPASGVWNTYALPTNAIAVAGLDGTRALMRTSDGADHLLQLNSDNTTAELPLTGLPDPTIYNLAPFSVDVHSGTVAVVTATPRPGLTGVAQSYLVKLDTGEAVPLPAGTGIGWNISDGYLYRVAAQAGQVTVLSMKVSDVLAGTVTTPTTSAFTPSGAPQYLGVTGGSLFFTIAAQSLYALPLTGNASPVQLEQQLGVTPTIPVASGPGGVVAVGGASGAPAVTRFAEAADGSLNTTVIRQLTPPPATTSTLSMVYGEVHQVLTVPQLDGTAKFGSAPPRSPPRRRTTPLSWAPARPGSGSWPVSSVPAQRTPTAYAWWTGAGTAPPT